MSESGAQWPDPGQLCPAEFIAAPHPSTLAVDELLSQCQLRTQRRSGPGGQHRNKTSSGVFLEHVTSGFVGEATERRSQAQNRDVALIRLRMKLATFVRTASPLADPNRRPSDQESRIRTQYGGSTLRVSETNVDRPALIAMLLDDLRAAGGQPSLVAQAWDVSTSALVRLLRSHPPSLKVVNQVRSHHHRPPLR